MTQASLIDRAAGWLSRRMQQRVPYSESNPFLEGPFAPVPAETTATELKVTGHIPVELNGLLARIGPNPVRVGNPATYHWFMGDGMVHGLRLGEGRALWYRNRWVGSDSANEALGRPLLPGWRRGVVDTVNTNIIGQGGRLWALVEAGALPVELDSELNSLRHGLFDSTVSTAFTAHPHRDPQTGELHAVCYDATRPNRLRYLAIGPDCRLLHQADIPVRHGPMVHDCAITASRVVLLDLPVTFSVGEIFRGSGFPYHWNARHEARVGLLPKHGRADQVQWFAVDPCYVFHTCNACDLEDGSVLLDVVVHDRMFDRSRQGPDSQRITFERWWLDPRTRRVERTVRSDVRQEFPRFDERRTGLHYRYAYTVGADLDRTGPQPLYRYDLQRDTVQRHDYAGRGITGEAVFVPRHAGAAEDDGWLLSYVYRLDHDRSDVVILNAADVEGEPQAVIHLPVRVPLGFHGNWIADPA